MPASLLGVLWLASQLFTESVRQVLRKLSLGVFFFIGMVVLNGKPPFPPVEASHVLAYAVGVSGVIFVLSEWFKKNRWLLIFLFFSLHYSLLLWPLIQNSWSSGQSVAMVLGLSCLTLALEFVLNLNPHQLAWFRPLQSLMIGGVLSIISVFLGSLLIGQAIGVFCGLMACLIVLRVVWPKWSGHNEETLFISTSLGSFLSLAWTYLEAEPASLVVLISPIFLIGLRAFLPWKNKSVLAELILLMILSIPALAFVLYRLWIIYQATIRY